MSINFANNFYKLALLLINKPDSNKEILIAYKENIFFISYDFFTAYDVDELSAQEQELFEIIKLSLPEFNNFKNYSPEEYFQYIIDRPDVIIANYNKSKSELILLNNVKLNPISSNYLKKITKQLNIAKIISSESSLEDGDELYSTHHYHEMIGDLPDSLYHGTSLKNAYNILRDGLTPQPNKSNFPNLIRHYDRVFLTSDFQKAAFHAWKATDNEIPKSYMSQKRPKDNFGIIFKFKIPDKSKIVPDFDAENQAKQYNLKPLSHSKELGWIGYEGRIPSSFIEEIYFLDNQGNKKLLSKQELLEIDEYGMMPLDYESNDDL